VHGQPIAVHVAFAMQRTSFAPHAEQLTEHVRPDAQTTTQLRFVLQVRLQTDVVPALQVQSPSPSHITPPLLMLDVGLPGSHATGPSGGAPSGTLPLLCAPSFGGCVLESSVGRASLPSAAFPPFGLAS